MSEKNNDNNIDNNFEAFIGIEKTNAQGFSVGFDCPISLEVFVIALVLNGCFNTDNESSK